MASRVLLSLRDGVSIEVHKEDVALVSPGVRYLVNRPCPGMLESLNALSEGATEDSIVDFVDATEDPIALAELYYHMRRWCLLGLLKYTLVIDGRAIATTVPVSSQDLFESRGVDVDTRFRLSRFAYCRRERESLILESPLSLTRTVLHGYLGAAVMYGLVRPEPIWNSRLRLLACNPIVRERWSASLRRLESYPAILARAIYRKTEIRRSNSGNFMIYCFIPGAG